MQRYRDGARRLILRGKPKLFHALRERLKEPYDWKDLRADTMAGVIVGMIAIPLAMALAIASGVPPHYGLYTAIVAGVCTPLLGGSRFQVTGPTAAFVVVLAPVAQEFGVSGLLTAGYMAGVILLIFGLARVGRLIEFIPYPVITGFTAGIAVVIAALQLKDFFGLSISEPSPHALTRMLQYVQAIRTINPAESFVGLMTLALLYFWPKINKRIPGPLIVMPVVTILVHLTHKFWPGFHVETIDSRYVLVQGSEMIRGIPGVIPNIDFPWNRLDAAGVGHPIQWETIKLLGPTALTIALLGSIESLLSAVMADGMSKTTHDPDSELMALGFSNLLCPLFGGIAATGAIARTATNIRYGARSPFASVIHSLFILLVILFFSNLVSMLPMAALAALLLIVAYNIADIPHVARVLRVAPRSDALVLATCLGLTVAIDMVAGVVVGMMLASLLFMRRMAILTSGEVLVGDADRRNEIGNIPKGLVLYRIAGPLFFGAARKAIHAVSSIANPTSTGVVLLMNEVPTLDITGLVALESSIEPLLKQGKRVVLVGVQDQPRTLMNRSEILSSSKIEFCSSLGGLVEKS